ncbi:MULTISPECIES: DUF397 domain-containing protein [Actinoalloteichus]|uniref:DUF397 domain-containing protein n=1 Tax=Actinoalloteichus TaxID=65496 RepID=UPI00095175CF|nr:MULTISPECIES: DUF397 domain-containing protein [Actinoalloteichus]
MPVERAWFKSSRSGGNNANCVEVRFASGGVDVRDSKNAAGPRLSVSSPVWVQFLDDLRGGRATMDR